MDETALARLEALAREVRAFLEPHWAAWHEKAGAPKGRRCLSEGTCGRSSRFLCDLLRREGYDAEMAFGSPVECDCGFHAEEGWKGHAWVMVADGSVIIDLTADQFGAAPVIVTEADDPRYRAAHDVAEAEWIAERQRVAHALMRAWEVRGLVRGRESASSGAEY